MYSICNIVCGHKIPRKVRDYIDECDGDYRAAGFDCFYSGSDNEIPTFTGVVIGRLEEGDDIEVSKLIKKLTATEEQILAAKQEISETKQKFIEYMQEDKETSDEEKIELLNSILDMPETLLVWSTS